MARLDLDIALWDAINAVVIASGGSASNTSVARQKAAVIVNQTVEAIAAARAEDAERHVGEALREVTAGRDAYARDNDRLRRQLDEARALAARWRDVAVRGSLWPFEGPELPWEVDRAR